MNELISQIQWHILGLPIQDSMKKYYYNFLKSVRASYRTEREKLQTLQMLLAAIKARYKEHWLNSPLVVVFDTIVNTLEDIGKGAITGAKAGLELTKPINLIIILSVIAIIGLIIFLVISKVKP